jgi:hypothetical protein
VKLVFHVEDVKVERKKKETIIQFSANLKFLIVRMLPLAVDKMIQDDKEKRYLVLPNLDSYAFPEAIDEMFYEDSKEWKVVKEGQILLRNLNTGKNEVCLKKDILWTYPVDLPALSVRQSMLKIGEIMHLMMNSGLSDA